MKISMKSTGGQNTKEVRKPYLTGSIFEERSVRSIPAFFGTIIIIIFVTFIACASAIFSNFLLRLLLNGAAIILGLIILFNIGSKRGADDVNRGEILWKKREKGQPFSDSEQRMCFHPMKGYITGLIGMLPLFIVAVLLALNTSVQMTGSGTLPSWMQAYTKRSDIGNALINYVQPEGMHLIDYLRAAVRIAIIPYVNLIGSDNKTGLMILERISPLIMLLPAAAYGTGYLTGRNIRTQIHTAISENEKKRIRKERKQRKARASSARSHEPEQLN